MSAAESTIDLDSSSVLSSTKNTSMLEDTRDSTIVLSSDTEGEDEDDEEEEEGEELGAVSVSETVDSTSSAPREVEEEGTSEEESGTSHNLYVTAQNADKSSVLSVLSASELISTDTTLASSVNTTKEGASLTTLESLTVELANHPARLSEEVVEGEGEIIGEINEITEKGDGARRKRGDSVSEIIEETFRNKPIASKFGETENHQMDSPDTTVTSVTEEANVSPTKRKGPSSLSEGEVADVEDEGLVNMAAIGGLPAKRQRVVDPDLPSTCSVLTCPNNNARVYLVGTAHFSKESCEDVALVIQAVQPDIVMVELCKNRTNILHLDETTILEEAQNLDLEKSIEIIRTQGTVQGVMYLLLLSMSAHLTKELGMAPGGEFRRAFVEAKKVPGCMVHLGDRPINITLKRALAALGPWQKLRLGWNILTSRDPITKEEVERCKDRDLLENMLSEMAGEFPALSRVFVEERDLFLAHSLQMAAESGGPGQQPPTVVGVVGIGHMPGMVENWGKVTREQVKEVVRVDPPSVLARILTFTVKTAFWGGCLYGAYRLSRGPVTRLLLVAR